MFYILRWLIYRDFKDARSAKIGSFNNSSYPPEELFKMIFSKLFYFFYMIIIPALLVQYNVASILLAFFILTVSGSLVIAMVLISTHVGENSSFPEPDENGLLPHSWSYHQVITTSDFSTDNWLINQLFGGFNHHVVHHLFPNICHIHYPKLTPILKKTAEKYNLPYKHNKYLFMAMLSHFKLLLQNGKKHSSLVK